MIGVGIIGYGYWGPNLVRNFMGTPGARVVAVSDLRPERLAKVTSVYPSVEVTTDFHDLLRDSRIAAVAVATPVSSHYELTLQALQAGKHVLVEKPMTENSQQGFRLVDEAARRNLVLMVDHTFLYTGAVRKMRDLVVSNELGRLYYYDSVRVNLGLFQHDVNVLWDLAVHDISIIDYLFPQRPSAVSAIGVSHVAGEPENTAYLTLFFEDAFLAHIHANWLAPVKVRRTLIGGSKKSIVYDDIEPSEKVKVYDKGITLNNSPENVYKMLIKYRTGDMWAPQLDSSEALQVELLHFVECIEKGARPITDGVMGLRIVQILEAASQSMVKRGRVMELQSRRMAA
jgi:predicted dehydrogenase